MIVRERPMLVPRAGQVQQRVERLKRRAFARPYDQRSRHMREPIDFATNRGAILGRIETRAGLCADLPDISACPHRAYAEQMTSNFASLLGIGTGCLAERPAGFVRFAIAHVEVRGAGQRAVGDISGGYTSAPHRRLAGLAQHADEKAAVRASPDGGSTLSRWTTVT